MTTTPFFASEVISGGVSLLSLSNNQAPQYIGSLEVPETYDGCFACLDTLIGHFHSLQHVQDSRSRDSFKDRYNHVTGQYWLPVPLDTFCGKLTESVRIKQVLPCDSVLYSSENPSAENLVQLANLCPPACYEIISVDCCGMCLSLHACLCVRNMSYPVATCGLICL